MFKLLEISILFFALGNVIFSYKFHGKVHFVNFISLIISIIYVLALWFIPNDMLLKKILRINSSIDRENIDLKKI